MLLVGWLEEHPACKNWEVGAGVVICLEWGTDLHMAQLMPLPLTVSCFSEIQIAFTVLVPAHPVVPEKGPLNGCVCVHQSKILTCTLSTVGVRETKDLQHNWQTGPSTWQDHFISDWLKTMFYTITDIWRLTVFTPWQHTHRLVLYELGLTVALLP